MLSAGKAAPPMMVQQAVDLALERIPGIQAVLADAAAARARMTGASVLLRSNRLDDRGRDAAEIAGDLLSRQSLSEAGDHEEAQRGAVAIGLSASGDQSASRRPIEPGNLVHGKVSSSVVVDLASATIDGRAFPFNLLPAVRGRAADRDSRTMI